MKNINMKNTIRNGLYRSFFFFFCEHQFVPSHMITTKKNKKITETKEISAITWLKADFGGSIHMTRSNSFCVQFG